MLRSAAGLRETSVGPVLRQSVAYLSQSARADQASTAGAVSASISQRVCTGEFSTRLGFRSAQRRRRPRRPIGVCGRLATSRVRQPTLGSRRLTL